MPIEIRNNRDADRYELLVDGRVVGIAEYRIDGTTMVLPHTEITPSLRGRGYGAQLVRHALDDARRQGFRVVPRCWFVAEFIRDNPSYADLLAA